MKYLTNLNLDQNQLQNAVIHNETDAPLTPLEGQVYYDTEDHRIYWFNGTTWVAADAVDATMTAADIVAAINASAEIIDEDNLPSTLINETELATALSAYALSGHNHSLDSLSNVTVTDNTAGELLLWNGSAWINRTLAEAGIAAAVHTHVASDITDLESAISANADVAANTAARHTQNTDTGTDSTTFQIGTGGPILQSNNDDILMARNAAGDDYADFAARHITVSGDLIVLGTTTTVDSTIVSIGDNELELNAGVSEALQNTDGGIAIKRLAPDDTTRVDAKLTYSEATDRWTQTFGPHDGSQVTTVLPVKLTGQIGNGIANTFNITHNLNTRDVTVLIRETGDDYEMVMADVLFGLNAITVNFAVAPASNQYTVTIIG